MEDWTENRIHVNHELARIARKLDEMDKEIKAIRAEDIPAIRESLAALKVKTAIWGGASGTLAGTLVFLLSRMF